MTDQNEARKLLCEANRYVSAEWETQTGERKADILAAAQVRATLAVAEQLRIANLVKLGIVEVEYAQPDESGYQEPMFTNCLDYYHDGPPDFYIRDALYTPCMNFVDTSANDVKKDAETLHVCLDCQCGDHCNGHNMVHTRVSAARTTVRRCQCSECNMEVPF